MIKKSKKLEEKDIYKKAGVSEKELKDTKVHEKELLDLLQLVERQNEKKWEKYFIPALAVWTFIVIAAYAIIYSITQDMTRLADSIDPKMSENMSAMSKSIDSLANNVSKMTVAVNNMDENFISVARDMKTVSNNISYLKPILANMVEININMKSMSDSMIWMQGDTAEIRRSIRPMKAFNNIPFL